MPCPLSLLSRDEGSLRSKLADILLWLMVLRLIPSSKQYSITVVTPGYQHQYLWS